MNIWDDLCKIWSDPLLWDPIVFAWTVVGICTVVSFVVVYSINQLCRFVSWLFTTPPPQAALVKGLLSYFEEDRDWVWDRKASTLSDDKVSLYVVYNNDNKMWVLLKLSVRGEWFDDTSFCKSDWKHVHEVASETVSDYFIEVNQKREEEAVLQLKQPSPVVADLLKRIEELEKGNKSS